MWQQIRHIFLDDGGVMNDNARRSLQWPMRVGEFFAPRLGGTPERWVEANRSAIGECIERHVERITHWDETVASVDEVYRQYDVDWLRTMCAAVGVAAPELDEACIELGNEATRLIMPRVHADLPGVIDAVRRLATTCKLYTASRGRSWELRLTLDGMGLTECFDFLYGPDLVNTPKEDSRYYERIFVHAGVRPDEALVVDDGQQFLDAAAAAGAHILRIGVSGVDGVPSLDSLAELPALIAKGK